MARRLICGAQLTLHRRYAHLALVMPGDLPAGTPDEVERTLRCALECDHPGSHYDLVRQLPAPSRSVVWACWNGDSQPCGLVTLPDCCRLSCSGGQGEPCTLWEGHPAGHDWEFADPEQERLAAAAAAFDLLTFSPAQQPS